MTLKSLSEICLDVIVENFERFNRTFVQTEDAYLKRNFEFLQRCYADIIVTNLASVSLDEGIKEEYFPLAINRYLKKFNTSCLISPGSWSTVEKIMSKIGDGLRKVNFSSDYSNDPFDVSILSHLKNLKVLSMAYICTDEVMTNIVKFCPHLVDLDINGSLVTNEGIKHLCEKNGKEVINDVLQTLNISNTAIEDDIIPVLLLNLPSLEVLQYDMLPEIIYNMHKRDINENIPTKIKKYKLKVLDGSFLESKFSDILKLYSEICPDIENLVFHINNIEQIDLCAQFSKLTNVDLKCESDIPIDVNTFLKLRGEHITFLKLSGFSFCLLNLSNCCKSLRSLYLGDIVFQSFTKDNIPVFKHLKEFTLLNTNFNDTFATISTNLILSSSPNLDTLNLTYCKEFNPELKREIIKCCSRTPLKVINFAFSEVDMPLLESILFTSTSLNRLRIIHCELISYDDLDVLRNMADELKNAPEIDYSESESEISSDTDYDEIFDEYDDYYDYGPTDTDDDHDYDDYEDYDDYGPH